MPLLLITFSLEHPHSLFPWHCKPSIATLPPPCRTTSPRPSSTLRRAPYGCTAAVGPKLDVGWPSLWLLNAAKLLQEWPCDCLTSPLTDVLHEGLGKNPHVPLFVFAQAVPNSGHGNAIPASLWWARSDMPVPRPSGQRPPRHSFLDQRAILEIGYPFILF